jgi:hypothetical protein
MSVLVEGYKMLLMETTMTNELEQLESTSPEIVTAFLAVAFAYEKLWAAVALHPSDREFVAGMLGVFHGASVIPQMEKL